MQSTHGLLTLAARDSALPAPYSFAEFERRAVHAREAARRRERQVGGVALASVVLSLIAGSLFVGNRTPAPATGDAGPRPALTTAPVEPTSAESWLASAPPEPVVVRVGTYAAVAALEDRIAFIDDSMNDSRLAGDPEVDPASLARERSRLIDTLARVRYAQAVAGSLN